MRGSEKVAHVAPSQSLTKATLYSLRVAKGQQVCLRWRGLRQVVKALSDYVYQVEELRNGNIKDIHGNSLKFYHDK